MLLPVSQNHICPGREAGASHSWAVVGWKQVTPRTALRTVPARHVALVGYY